MKYAGIQQTGRIGRRRTARWRWRRRRSLLIDATNEMLHLLRDGRRHILNRERIRLKKLLRALLFWKATAVRRRGLPSAAFSVEDKQTINDAQQELHIIDTEVLLAMEFQFRISFICKYGTYGNCIK